MKILYTNFHPRNGGGHTTYVTSLARSLADTQQITVASPGTSRLFRYAAAVPGVRAVHMRFSTRLSSWLNERAALSRLIARERYDIIHVNGSADHKQVMLALAGQRQRPRVVFTKHNDLRLDTPGHWLRAHLATDRVIAVSDYVRRLLEHSAYRHCAVDTIRHGIDTAHFAPLQPQAVDALRDRHFGVDWRGKLLLGSAGGTDYDKGWLDLVEAAGSLPANQRERILILVAGDPPNEAKLARVHAAGMRGQVVFPGLLDDVRDALACCHAGFVLSYREALSYACREMMSLGLPALVSNAGGLPENVTDGVDGWIMPVRDVPAIATVLQSMLQDPDRLAAMGAAARRTAVGHFGLACFAQATLNAYRQALAA
ncbi:glycosyltransferase family 4 protein [Bordetella sp. BOR01]|uniref:glycosyltransferase family 4 protein n=1 Tax=Bordetella sp. BOR01 TaxID=2854779 RepID=UPI001C4502D9|nr:glycosyltransferase family 4 protein [Bordetella sp. BOR01]